MNTRLVTSVVQYAVIAHKHWAQGADDDGGGDGDDDDDGNEQPKNTEYFEIFSWGWGLCP